MRRLPQPLTPGQRFGRYVVLEVYPREKNNRRVRCRCDCGVEKIVFQANLSAKRTTSCGCFCSERNAFAGIVHGEAGAYGAPSTAEYRAWVQMKCRCSDLSDPYYGGRGIQVCERWENSFEAFLQDMGRKPSSRHSLDRIDNDGNYEPGNCRWATRKQQQSNTSRNRYVLLEGERLTLTDAAQRLGVCQATVRKRLQVSP